MAYCSKCGTQINEGVNFCPKCGSVIDSNVTNPKPQNKSIITPQQQKDNDDAKLGTGKKIGLGWAIAVASIGLLMGFEAGIGLIIVSACSLAILICLLMGKIDAKYIWTAVIVLPLIVFFTIGAYADDKQNPTSTTTEQKQEAEADRKAKQQNEKAERKAQEQKEEAERQTREKKEKESQLAQKKKEVEEKAYKAGYSHGLRQGPVTYSRDNPKDAARIYFNTAYGIPSSSEEKDMLNLFLEHYVKGYHDGYKSKEE